MNRSERRKQERKIIRQRERMWPDGFCTIHDELKSKIKDGDKFTIQGLRRRKDGTYETNCKYGKETVWIAEVKK
jgi:hypothetical protein